MILTENRKANFDYQILEAFEAGLILTGPEVKSARAGQIDLKGAYVIVNARGEAYLEKSYIAPYKPARTSQKNYDPNRARKLLLTKKEINYLLGKQNEKTVSIIPLSVHLAHNLIKIKIAVARGKKKFDKRESIKKREFERQKRQTM
jgi:SsrA-binding protein